MRRAHLSAILIATFAATSCGVNHRFVPRITPPASKYPQLLNPYSVMDALRLAYEARDTVEIKLLYDDGYEGSSADLTGPPPYLSPMVILKGGEVQHVSALARDHSIRSISMILGTNMQRYDDPADPPGWATIGNPITSLEVSDSTVTRRVDIANETMEFKFIHTAPPP